VGDKAVDVDGQFGAFITRAFARVSVAVAVGNAQRLELWLRTPNLVAGIQAIAPAAAAAMINLDVADMDADEDEAEDEEEGEVVKVEMGVVGFAAVAAGLIDFFLDLIRQNLTRLDVMYVNECAGITNVEKLLFLVYEVPLDTVQLDTVQVFDVPVVDDEVKTALGRIRCDNLVVNYGLKD
jgi:hypothetical protein